MEDFYLRGYVEMTRKIVLKRELFAVPSPPGVLVESPGFRRPQKWTL
jgi:hypothetical protein